MLPDAAAGGGHIMNFRLASILGKRGSRVEVAILFDRNRGRFEDAFPGVKVTFLHADSRLRRVLLPWRLAHLARGYDIVLAGLDLAATTYSFLASKLAKRPMIAWVHIAFSAHMAVTSWLHRRLNLEIFRRLTYIVFPSEGARHSMEQALGGRPAGRSWLVIRNFTVEPPPPPPCPPELREILDKPVIISIGRLAPQKAYQRLIRAHAALLQQGIDNNLVILGEGPQRQELEAEVDRLGVGASVFLPGHISEVGTWLSKSTLFALCSDYEGLPLVLLEALQYGIPVVSMDCPAGPREILDDGHVGLLTPKGDETAFQNALARLLSSSELQGELTRRGLERAKHYSIDEVIADWDLLLKHLADSGQASPSQSPAGAGPK